MEKIVLIGSLNMDIIIKVPHIPKVGETILACGVSFAEGGKGANQAVAIGKLGGDIHMIGRVGNDSHGRQLHDNLKNNGVHTEGVSVDDEKPTGTAYINVSGKGENNIIVNSGANANLDAAQIDSFEAVFEGAKYCVVQFEIPIPTIEYIAKICMKKDIKLIINPAPAVSMDYSIFKDAYMIIPNETELDIIIPGDKTLEEKAVQLKNIGYENVIVTLGEKGSLHIAQDGRKEYFEAVRRFETVDTTGAGDSFIGALTQFLAEGEDISGAIKKASLVAALAVSKPGAQASIPDRKTVESYL